jgi:hypothetical protein
MQPGEFAGSLDDRSAVASRRAAGREAWVGVVAAVLFLAAFAIAAPAPSPDAPGAELGTFLAERHGRLLLSSGLIALAGAFYVWFLSTLQAWLNAWQPGIVRSPGATSVVLAAGATGTAILVSGGALQSALALHSSHVGEELIRFGFDAYNSLITIAGASFGTSVMAAALAGARSGALPPWAVRSAVAVAALQFATLAGLAASSGFFAAGGLLAAVAFWALAGWFIVVSVWIARRPEG